MSVGVYSNNKYCINTKKTNKYIKNNRIQIRINKTHNPITETLKNQMKSHKLEQYPCRWIYYFQETDLRFF